MFQKIYKNQKRNLLRNWGVLNNRAINNKKQCKKQQPVEDRLVVAPKQTLPALDNVNFIYAGRHYEYFTSGPWIHYNRLNFWGLFGLSAAVITGIRYGNLKTRSKYHTKQPEQVSVQTSVGSWVGSYVLINPFAKVSNLFSEYNILYDHGLTTLSKICLQKQTRLSILPETKKSSVIFGTGNSSISNAIVPSGREISEPSTVSLNEPIDDLSSTSSNETDDHELSGSSGFGEVISSKQTSTKSCRSLSSYSFLSSDSFEPTFCHDGATPFSRCMTQSYVHDLNLQQDIKVASGIKIDSSEQISSAISDLVKFLSGTMGDILADETCNMATELARNDDYKRAIDIWNSILLKNPLHGKTLYNLATCFENGLGVKINLVKAKELYEKASNVNHPRSCYRLARIHLREWKHGSQASLTLYQDYLSKSASFGFMKVSLIDSVFSKSTCTLRLNIFYS